MKSFIVLVFSNNKKGSYSMKWTTLRIAALTLLLLAPGAIIAQKKSLAHNRAGRAEDKSVLPVLQLTEFTLPNGLKVILHPDRSTPIVAINTYYHVGSRDEAPGRTGFAHLFEHMLFQGSKNYNGLFSRPIEKGGGFVNGTTDEDRTMYYEVVPSNFLDLALFLEADRMGNLLEAMTQEKLDNQRDVVKNEKRQRIDNQPYLPVYYKIAATMFPKGHPYNWLPIGSMEDLSAASMDDVRDFFRRNYVPNNATLVLAGDFDPQQARRLVENYFGPIKRGAPVRRVNAPQPKLERQVREQMEDRVSLERIYLNWHGVPFFAPDDAALDTLAAILASGKSSRLYKSLVYEKQLAQDVYADHDSRQIAGIFGIVSTVKPGKALPTIEAAINEEIENIKSRPPSQEEIERAYNERETDIIANMQTVLNKSVTLNHFNFHQGRPDYYNQNLARYRRVTPMDVQRVARKYLTDKHYALSVVPVKQQQAATREQKNASGPGSNPARVANSQAGVSTAVKAETQNKFEADEAKLPEGAPDPQLKLPGIQRRKLSNGLEVLIVEHHEVPVVSMNLVLKTGAAADPRDRPGLAYFTANLLDEGTKTRTALEISNQLSSTGSSILLSTDWDSSAANLFTTTRHLERTLKIFSDILLNPSFPREELDRVRASRLAALKQQRNLPNAVSALVYPKLIYGSDHPYGHLLQGDEASTAAVTVEDVRNFYEAYYRPNNAALIVVGDVAPDRLMPQLEKALAHWESKQVPTVDVTAEPAKRDRTTIYLVDKPGAVQSVLSIGHLGVPRTTADYFPLLVLNRILGGTSAARVGANIRESKGYSYGAFTTFAYRRGPGLFSGESAVKTEVTKESIAEFLNEFRGIRGDRPVTREELELAKQGLVRGYPRGFETPAQISGRLADVVLYGLPDDYFDKFMQNLEAVTEQDLARVAERYLDPSRMAILVVGDRQAIESSLRSSEFGESLTHLDADGRAITGSGSGREGNGIRQ
jgi:zinc protease